MVYKPTLAQIRFVESLAPPTQEISRLLHIHLRSTEYLSAYCWQHSIMCFKIRPKHHYLWHVARDVLANKLNPRVHHVWAEERFLGCVKRIAVHCHGATVQKRAIERYLIALSQYMAKLPS